jgi:hypothetical protein
MVAGEGIPCLSLRFYALVFEMTDFQHGVTALKDGSSQLLLVVPHNTVASRSDSPPKPTLKRNRCAADRESRLAARLKVQGKMDQRSWRLIGGMFEVRRVHRYASRDRRSFVCFGEAEPMIRRETAVVRRALTPVHARIGMLLTDCERC